MADSIESRLESLDRSPGRAAMRFDAGPPLGAHAVVLPSAFNPPTLAHLELLGAAPLSGRLLTSDSPLAARIALLTTKNVDKGLHGASLAHRVGMLLALRADSPGLAVVASNQARIMDQATSLEETFGPLELMFVVGFDTLERLFAPRYYSDMERELAPFFERNRVLAANRGRTAADDVARWIEKHAGPFVDRITVLEIDEYPASLSSTQVREAVAAGDSPHPAVSPAVRRYIEEHGLYR